MLRQSWKIWVFTLLFVAHKSNGFQFDQLYKALRPKPHVHHKSDGPFPNINPFRHQPEQGPLKRETQQTAWSALPPNTPGHPGPNMQQYSPAASSPSAPKLAYYSPSGQYSPSTPTAAQYSPSDPTAAQYSPSAGQYSPGAKRGEIGVAPIDVYSTASAYNQARVVSQSQQAGNQNPAPEGYNYIQPAVDAHGEHSTTYYETKPAVDDSQSQAGYGNNAAAAGTLSAAYTSPNQDTTGHDHLNSLSQQGSIDPYETSAQHGGYSSVSSGFPDQTLYSSADSSLAAGGYSAGSAGGYSGGSGGYSGGSGYGGSSASEDGHSSGGSEKGNVVYTLVPGSGTGDAKGGQKGGDSHSHLLSAIAPLFLLSTLFLPLGVSLGTAAAAASTGRRRRSFATTNDQSSSIGFLKGIGPLEAARVHQEMIARYMMCSGLADESNHCLEGLACLEASPQHHTSVLPEVDTDTLQATVQMLMHNEFLPARLRERLRKGAMYGATNPRQCQRKYVCQAPVGLPVKRFGPTDNYPMNFR